MAWLHFFSLPAWLRATLTDSFKKYLVLFLLFLGLVIYTAEHYQEKVLDTGVKQVSFFFHPLCPHCQKQKKFNSYLKAKYPELKWAEYDISIQENADFFVEFVERSGHTQHKGVPRTYIGTYEIFGFHSEQTTGVALENAIQAYIKDDPSLFNQESQEPDDTKPIQLPILGEINYTEYSLFSLAAVLGLVDGFNPCAMWVLVYLISMIMTLKDRKKIWFLVGTFIVASGVLYFLFMTAWLNVFLFLGYLRILTLTIGLVAIGAGILDIRKFLHNKEEIACEIGDVESKKKTMNRIYQIVQAPLTFFTILGIIALAFVVNSIEFACSSALPAIFTHTLALSNLTTLQHYGYILLYDFFFMLDDLIIFSLAVLALDTNIGQRYTKYCKIIGGLVLLILGGIMVFQPGMLH
jgi:hypothetical protein